MLVHWKALFADATQLLLNMMDSHPAMSQNALNKHWVGVPNDWSLMIPMVLVLTDYFKVSISTTRLAFQQPDYSTELLLLEEILQHLLSTKTLWNTYIYSPLSTGVFSGFLPSTISSTSIRRFFTAKFPGRGAFRSASETEESWWSMEGSKSCCGEVWGLHLSMRSCGSPKVEGAYMYNTYIYI